MSGLEGFEPLSDELKIAIVPDLARRSAALHRLVHQGMVRQPENAVELEIAELVAELYPGVYEITE